MAYPEQRLHHQLVIATQPRDVPASGHDHRIRAKNRRCLPGLRSTRHPAASTDQIDLSASLFFYFITEFWIVKWDILVTVVEMLRVC